MFLLLLSAMPVHAESGLKTPLALASIGQMLAALVLVVALILLCAWVFRRMNGFSRLQNTPIKILSSTPLGARERLLLVAVGEEQLLIGVCPGRIQTLHVLQEKLPVLDRTFTPMSSSFAHRLHDALLARRPEPAGDST